MTARPSLAQVERGPFLSFSKPSQVIKIAWPSTWAYVPRWRSTVDTRETKKEVHLEQQQQTTTITNNNNNNKNNDNNKSNLAWAWVLQIVRIRSGDSSPLNETLIHKTDFSVAIHTPISTTCTRLSSLFPASATHSCFPLPRLGTSELFHAPHS